MDRTSKMADFKPQISGIKLFNEKIPSIKLTTFHIQKIKKYYKGYFKK
jgi:hypothetical protein